MPKVHVGIGRLCCWALCSTAGPLLVQPCNTLGLLARALCGRSALACQYPQMRYLISPPAWEMGYPHAPLGTVLRNCRHAYHIAAVAGVGASPARPGAACVPPSPRG